MSNCAIVPHQPTRKHNIQIFPHCSLFTPSFSFVLIFAHLLFYVQLQNWHSYNIQTRIIVWGLWSDSKTHMKKTTQTSRTDLGCKMLWDIFSLFTNSLNFKLRIKNVNELSCWTAFPSPPIHYSWMERRGVLSKSWPLLFRVKNNQMGCFTHLKTAYFNLF